MSIIQEALKKAQSDVKPPAPSPAEIPQVEKPLRSGSIPAAKPAAQKIGTSLARNKHTPMIALSLVVIVFAIPVAGRLLSLTGGRSNRASGTNVQEISYKPIVADEAKNPNPMAGQNQPSISAGILKLSDRPDLVLNGIMYLEEGPRAIINNFIVAPGDLVSGAKVTKISRKNVILEYRDVEITLSLK